MEVSQKYHKIPIYVFFLFRKIGAKVESGKVRLCIFAGPKEQVRVR